MGPDRAIALSRWAEPDRLLLNELCVGESYATRGKNRNPIPLRGRLAEAPHGEEPA